MKRLAAFAVLLIVLAAPAWAGFDEGLAAAKRGDYATALREWWPLADMGNATAQYNLGILYARGQGVPQDDVQAVKWFRKAAMQGQAEAQSNLGLMSAQGQGVIQNYVQAHMWLNLAVAQGNKQAAKSRDIVAKRMTPADISKAQRLAREWLEKHRAKKK